MPIFAYHCQTCDHRFDALQKLNAAPIEDCPQCYAPELRKLLSAPNVHLRGGRQAAKDQPSGPKKKPRLVHTFDSPQPHAEHHSHSHSHSHSHKHEHASGHTHKHKHDD